MNEKEKELYDKIKWKHTNPTETLIKALKDINFGKNAVLLSIGTNDYETEKVLSENFENNEFIIATDVREKDADIVVNNHLLVLKESIDAENFTIDDFNKFFGNDNYKHKYGKPYVIYDRLSALWYSLYKGKTHLTKNILDNYIGILGDNGYLITDCYEHSEFINYIHNLCNFFIAKKYQKSTYELFKYYIGNIDLFIDKRVDDDKNKLNNLMIICKNNLLSLADIIGKISITGSPAIRDMIIQLKYCLIFTFPLIYIIDLLILQFIKILNIVRFDYNNMFLLSFFIYLILSIWCLVFTFNSLVKEIRN